MVNSGAVSGNLSESDSEAKDRFPRGFFFIIFLKTKILVSNLYTYRGLIAGLALNLFFKKF